MTLLSFYSKRKDERMDPIIHFEDPLIALGPSSKEYFDVYVKCNTNKASFGI
ncbi:hypothetical protein [Bacillus sp. FJAT-49736]|uniref:hypothetical protein n=1 Tax=Bacillus sp. FJAT-49736 TaxID=2833582 RepID=UPI001BC93702|nr:hypothetical protein [Bacillus sp. FJAT-49736]MBS4172193.1 hypothetical protein [Bacillus sp. FJAT-49736]